MSVCFILFSCSKKECICVTTKIENSVISVSENTYLYASSDAEDLCASNTASNDTWFVNGVFHSRHTECSLD